MSVIKTFLITFLLGTLISTQAQVLEDEGSRQFIDHPDKNEYLLSQPGTDKHKYGYELRENKHFHHTTTELDGVRLGCYGYVLDSKKYSTQYVADVKGYRPVYTYDAIEVYPKSGGTREASFVRNFEEDTDKSGNLRYFFPEGCRGFDSLISPQENPMTNKIKIPFPRPPPFRTDDNKSNIPNIPSPPRTSPPISRPPPVQPPPVTQPPPPSQIAKIPNVPKPPKVPEKYLPPSQNVIPSNDPLPTVSTRGKYVTKAIPPKAPQPTPPRFAPPVTNKPPAVLNNNNGCVGCCPDEESLPKIVIPIKLKNGSGKSGSCPSYAKLILPADNVNVNSLKTNPTELAKMVLQSLSQ